MLWLNSVCNIQKFKRYLSHRRKTSLFINKKLFTIIHSLNYTFYPEQNERKTNKTVFITETAEQKSFEMCI